MSNWRDKTSDYLHSNSGTLVGLILGVVLGVLLSLAVVWYVSDTGGLTLRKPDSAAPDSAVPADSVALPGKPGDAPLGSTNSSANGSANNSAGAITTDDAKPYTFYRTLPGQGPAPAPSANAQLRQPVVEAPKAPAAAKTPTTKPEVAITTAAKPLPPGFYYLQVGAFEEQSKADSLKANLALMSLEASIRADRVPGKNLLYRVRLGPYDGATAPKIRKQLADAGMAATLIHEDSQ